jgi:phage tail-like protein
MPVWNPVAKNNFYVFLVNADPRNLGEVAGAVMSVAAGIALAVVQGTFSEVTGLDSELEVAKQYEGGRNQGPLQFHSRGTPAPLTLKRGVTLNTDLWDWQASVMLGSKLRPLRKHGLILLTDNGWGLSGDSASPTASSEIPGGFGVPIVDKPPIAAWFFLNALPQKLTGPTLDAAKSELAIEELQLAHEGLYRLGPGLIPGGFGDVTALVGA